MRTALLRVEARRLLRDPVTLLVVVGLPLAFYLGFALGVPLPADLTDPQALRAGLMVGLAAYGAATAATTIAGQAALDRMHGWGRQLALTPLRDSDVVLVKAVVGALAAIAPTAVVFTAGALTGVRLPAAAWAGSAAMVVAGTAAWAAYGLTIGLAGRSQSATAAASAGLVVLAFVGDVFLPLSGTLQRLGQFTPMYGYVQLARFPIDAGRPVMAGQHPDHLWALLANCAVWAAVFVVAALTQVARARERR